MKLKRLIGDVLVRMPVAMVKDMATMGGICSGHPSTYTGEILGRIDCNINNKVTNEDLFELLKGLKKLNKE